VTYLEALNSACAIGQALLDRDLSITRPASSCQAMNRARSFIAWLPACGYPVCATGDGLFVDFDGFCQATRHFRSGAPWLVFADDGDRYAAALRACIPEDVEVVICRRSRPSRDGLRCLARHHCDQRRGGRCRCRQSDTIAKLLFTSGSTGVPKGVSTRTDVVQRPADDASVLPHAWRGASVLVDWLPGTISPAQHKFRHPHCLMVGRCISTTASHCRSNRGDGS